MTNPMITLINAEAASYEAVMDGHTDAPLHSENIDGMPTDIWRKISQELRTNPTYGLAIYEAMGQHKITHRSTRRSNCSCGWLGYHSQFAKHVGNRAIRALVNTIEGPPVE